MPKSMLQLVKETLREDDRLSSEGRLLQNKIMELTHKQDEELIGRLLSNDRIKNHFFTKVNGTLVFDKNEFIKFVSNKQFLPDSYTTFKNKIGLTANGKQLGQKKDVSLAWPYKDCVLEGEQVDPEEKREEVFWNEVLAPDEIDRLKDSKVLTNFKKFDEDGKHSQPELGPSDNLLIRGNNLFALTSLTRKFRKQVKLIYLDPPYNRDNGEFKYNNDFNHSTWLTFMKNRLKIAKEMLREDGAIVVQISHIELGYILVLMDEIFGRDNLLSLISWQRSSERTVLGQGSTPVINITEYLLVYSKNEESEPLDKVKKPILVNKTDQQGKVSESLRKLTSQYNKLFLSEGERTLEKELTTQSGQTVELYRHDGWEIQTLSKKGISDDPDKLYQKYVENFDNLARFDHQQKESTVEQLIIENTDSDVLYSAERVMTQGKRKGEKVKSYYLNDNVIYYLKDYAQLEEGQIYRLVDMNNFWPDDFVSAAGISEEGGVKLKRGKKPEELMRNIINFATEEGDIVLDFFLGSGTTAAVAHKMGRQYIGVEQLDYGENDPTVRLKNVIEGDSTGISDSVDWEGGGSFVYAELLKWNQKYIDKVEEAQTENELSEIWESIKEEAFLSYQVDPQQFDDNVEEFKNLDIEDQKDFLLKCLDKNHLYVNLSEIDDEEYDISEEDKKMNEQFYGGF